MARMARKLGLRAAVFAVVAAVPAGAALGQTTGTSHPDEIPVTTSPEGIAQPVVYEAPASGIVIVPAVPLAAVNRPVVQASVARPVLVQERESGAAVSEASVAPRDTARQMHLRDDPDAGIVTRVPGPGNELPVGAMLKIRLRQGLTTNATTVGTVFTAALVDAVERDGHVLLPAGSTVQGKVTEVHAGKRSSGSGYLHLEPFSVTLPDGTRYELHAQVIDTSLYRTTKVDDEGTISRNSGGKGTAAAIGLSTGAGAAAGGVFGGWPGAIVGGVVGAGISTVVWLRQDRQAELPAGTEVVLGLTGALAVGTE